MIKILICCGGGFSSSALATKVQKEIIEKNMQNQVSINFHPFTIANEVMKEYDILMACPHLKYTIPQFLKKHGQNCIPIYILPPKMYGTMNIEDVLEDAIDILNNFKTANINPYHFPGEDNVMRIQRAHSYRKTKNHS